MSQETVSEGGSLGELDGENAPEQNENTPAVDGNTPQVHEGNLTEGNTANTPPDDLATEHEMALYLQLYLGLPPPEPLDLRGRKVSENWRKFKQKYPKLRNCNWHKHEVKCEQNSYAANSHWQRCYRCF